MNELESMAVALSALGPIYSYPQTQGETIAQRDQRYTQDLASTLSAIKSAHSLQRLISSKNNWLNSSEAKSS